MDNIYYEKPEKTVKTMKICRSDGLVQWQMRPYNGFDDLVEQIEFFVDTVSGYNADFLLFPEYVNAPLMAEYNHLTEASSSENCAGIRPAEGYIF